MLKRSCTTAWHLIGKLANVSFELLAPPFPEELLMLRFRGKHQNLGLTLGGII